MTTIPAMAERQVVRVTRAGGPEVLELSSEPVQRPHSGEALVRVEAVGLNHAETLVRSGTYAVRLPFPYAAGLEGAGVVVEADTDVEMTAGARVCWTGVLGTCATFVVASADMLAPLPDELTFEQGASLAHAGITAQLLARVWPLDGATAVVWGAAGAVGLMLVATLAERGVRVIGIASGVRVEQVRAAGAALAIDRTVQDVGATVHACTDGCGAAAVYDPVGSSTFDTSLQMLAPRGCLINYGELSGPPPAINLHTLFERNLFVTKFNGRRYVENGETVASLVDAALKVATRRPAVISGIARRFPLERVREAYEALETHPSGKILVLPHDHERRWP